MVAEVDFVQPRVMADKGQPGLAVIQRLKDEILVFAVNDRLLGRPIVEINVVLIEHVVQTIDLDDAILVERSEEHTSELQSLMRISYAVFCLKKNKKTEINSSEKKLARPINNTD